MPLTLKYFKDLFEKWRIYFANFLQSLCMYTYVHMYIPYIHIYFNLRKLDPFRKTVILNTGVQGFIGGWS
jgi:hypothetical protein